MRCRELGVSRNESAWAGCEVSPTAAIVTRRRVPDIDSQSVKGADKGGCRVDPQGYDAGKKVRDKKRHVLVDTQGLLMHAVVHAADIQDPLGDSEAASLRESRDGGALVMATLFGLCPFLLKLYADSGYQGPKFQAGLRRAMRQVEVEVVKRSDTAAGEFVMLPKRWIVERTVAWLNRCRRLAKD